MDRSPVLLPTPCPSCFSGLLRALSTFLLPESELRRSVPKEEEVFLQFSLTRISHSVLKWLAPESLEPKETACWVPQKELNLVVLFRSNEGTILRLHPSSDYVFFVWSFNLPLPILFVIFRRGGRSCFLIQWFLGEIFLNEGWFLRGETRVPRFPFPFQPQEIPPPTRPSFPYPPNYEPTPTTPTPRVTSVAPPTTPWQPTTTPRCLPRPPSAGPLALPLPPGRGFA